MSFFSPFYPKVTMELSNLIWHLGAFVFAVWAAILAIKAKRRSQNCVEALLPVLFANQGALSREQLRSFGARIFEFFEEELSAGWGVRCSIVRTPLQEGNELRASAADLWNLLPQASRSFKNADEGAYEFEGQKISAEALVERVLRKGARARLAFERVPADAQGQACLAFWRVTRV